MLGRPAAPTTPPAKVANKHVLSCFYICIHLITLAMKEAPGHSVQRGTEKGGNLPPASLWEVGSGFFCLAKL